jgi:hypothetical protein
MSTVYSYIDDSRKVGAIYVDIRNAFPSVDHTILLNRIAEHANLGMPCGWFRSYLSDRTIVVDTGSAVSNSVTISRGVPQGSVLGPVLFNLYYSNVISEFAREEITLFADDTAIVAGAEDHGKLLQCLQARLLRIGDYLRSLKMDLNTEKTKLVWFCNETPCDLYIGNSAVKSCKSFKYLGIHIDKDLSWQVHVCSLYTRIQKMLYVLHRCSGTSNITRRLLLFRTYIYPHFLYGIQLYMLCNRSLRAKLEALLRRCCRVALRDSGFFPQVETKSVYVVMDVTPLRLTFQHSSAVMLFSAIILDRIPALKSLFVTVNQTNYNARHVPSDVVVLKLPRVKTERARHNFAYWGAKLWNCIPPAIRRSTTYISFSDAYSLYLLSKMDTVIKQGDHYDILDFV